MCSTGVCLAMYVVLQRCLPNYRGVYLLIQRCLPIITEVFTSLQKCLPIITEVFTYYYRGVYLLLQRCLPIITEVFTYHYRGVYLAVLVCCEDRILVTYEDNIPVVEVNEDFSPNTLLTDYYWLIKVSTHMGSYLQWSKLTILCV